MKEIGKEHAGITFVVVYSPPPSTQVISVQINVDFWVAGSIEAVKQSGAQIGVSFKPLLSVCRVPFNQCSTTKVFGLLLGTQSLLGHFLYNSFIY